jgi:hypothetical protein
MSRILAATGRFLAIRNRDVPNVRRLVRSVLADDRTDDPHLQLANALVPAVVITELANARV